MNLLLRPRVSTGPGEPLLENIWTWLPAASEDDDEDIVALLVAIHGRHGRLEKQP